MLLQYGWNDGLPKAQARMLDCGGSFSLRLDQRGGVEMIAASGKVYPPTELSDHITSRFANIPKSPL